MLGYLGLSRTRSPGAQLWYSSHLAWGWIRLYWSLLNYASRGRRDEGWVAFNKGWSVWPRTLTPGYKRNYYLRNTLIITEGATYSCTGVSTIMFTPFRNICKFHKAQMRNKHIVSPKGLVWNGVYNARGPGMTRGSCWALAWQTQSGDGCRGETRFDNTALLV